MGRGVRTGSWGAGVLGAGERNCETIVEAGATYKINNCMYLCIRNYSAPELCADSAVVGPQVRFNSLIQI